MSAAGTGVWGDTNNGRAVVGVVRERGDAVWGETVTGRGVVGVCEGDGAGVWGDTGTGRAIVGITHGQGDGVWGETKTGRGVVGVCEETGSGVHGVSQRGEGIRGESNAAEWMAGVAGYATREDGIGPGVLGEALGGGTGVFGRARRDAGVTGFHGDPRLQETTVGNDAARAGVFGASDVGPGVLAYTSRPRSAAVVAVGGIRAAAQQYPFAGEFFGKVQVNGDVEVTGDVFLPGADCAEHFDISAAGWVEPGDVVVIDEEGGLAQSRAAYDKRVAGIISGAGAFRPGLILDSRRSPHPPRADSQRLPVALVGKVYCKVDAKYGPIELGDLLTTSATPGHAMRAIDPDRSFGTIVGKALGTMTGGVGLIPVLVCLQ